jgi:GTP-binding protein HflX
MAQTAKRDPERVILVGVAGAAPRGRETGEGRTPAELRDELAELELLTGTAGGRVVGQLRQRRDTIHAGSFLSRGKLEQLKELVEAQRADLVIFDDDLSPVQARNLAEALDRKVIDRTELILDIFARRARSREAQLQVELAQLEYLLPRLTRMWAHLSRLGGGIGTRGPGETQLEVDRRRVRDRIGVLRRRLEAVDREREVQGRRRRRLWRIALVGYTNAGKSTLFNALTRAGVLEEDRLFATLDTTTRRLALPTGEVVLLSDTVGFIRKLPHHLVASFRATLREVREADLLIHVIDAAQPNFREQMAVVESAVEGLLDGRPAVWLLALNKADRLDEERAIALRGELPHAALLSALDRAQVSRFRARIADEARERGGAPAARPGRGDGGEAGHGA